MKRKSDAIARKPRRSEPPSWMDSSDAEFVENARRLVSAKGRAARERLVRDGFGGKFAAGLLGIYGRGALVWCINAFFTRTGQTAEGIVQVIIAGAFGDKAVIEAIGAALKEVQAERRPYPREIPTKVASLLSRTLSSTSISGRTKSEAKGGS